MSRPVAGIYQQTLIITLPGSPKAVDECLNALLSGGVLDHALSLSQGADSRQLHEVPSSSTDSSLRTSGHSYCEHNVPKPRTGGAGEMIPSSTSSQGRSNIPSYLIVPQRARISPYPLISLQDACQLVLKNITRLAPVTMPVNSSLQGHVLAEPAYAQGDIPRFPSSNVDGYAIRGWNSVSPPPSD